MKVWRSIGHEAQLEWNVLAQAVEPHKPPFDHLAHISGNNLFVSAYHGFAQLGRQTGYRSQYQSLSATLSIR